MLYLTCTTITSVDLAHYGVSRAKDWISVDCGTSMKTVFPRRLFCFGSFGDFRCGALLFVVIHVIYKYENR